MKLYVKCRFPVLLIIHLELINIPFLICCAVFYFRNLLLWLLNQSESCCCFLMEHNKKEKELIDLFNLYGGFPFIQFCFYFNTFQNSTFRYSFHSHSFLSVSKEKPIPNMVCLVAKEKRTGREG